MRVLERPRIVAVAAVMLMPLAASAQVRIWRDASGQHETRAEFVRVDAGKVHLRKSNGSLIAVSLERLSKADQEYVAASAAKWSEEPLSRNESGEASGKTDDVKSIRCELRAPVS